MNIAQLPELEAQSKQTLTVSGHSHIPRQPVPQNRSPDR